MSASARLLGLIVLMIFIGTLVPGVDSAQAAAMRRPDVIIVKLKPSSARTVERARGPMATGVGSLDRLNVIWDIRDFRRTVPAARPVAQGGKDYYGLSNYYTVELPSGTDLDAALAAYAADPNVEFAEPDYIMPMDMIPNDPDYSQQWTHYSAFDRDIDTQEGWDYEVGDSTVIVGIIDSGVLYNHADLKAAIWVNPGEDLDGDGVVWDSGDMNGVDDDGNGKIDDLIGWDFFSGSGCWPGEDCTVPDNDPSDFAGHGTHVGGIVAATTGNGTGVAGVAGGNRADRRPGVKIMALRVGYLADDGRGYVISDLCAAGIDYAVSKGVSVINCSWGSSGTLIHTAWLNAVAAGVVICKSAGNDNNEIPDVGDTTYGVLAVASLNQAGSKAGTSTYGTWVDISAPGEDIHNTFSDMGAATYADLSGTSMASPTVAGVAALLKSHHPWFTKTQIDTLLTNYVDDVYADNPGYIGKLGSGRVNARRALEILTTADFIVSTQFGKTPLVVDFTNTSPNAPSGPYEYTFGDGGTAGTADAQHTYNLPGIYKVTFTGSGPSGPHTRIRPEMIVVTEDTMQYGTALTRVGENGSLPIRIRNTHLMKQFTIPFKTTGLPNIFIDSIQKTALTTGWTGFGNPVYDNRFNGMIAWRFSAGSATPLPVGGGVVAHLWFHVLEGNTNDVFPVDSATLGFDPNLYSIQLLSNWADFKPEFVPGSITIDAPACDCPCQGDPICDHVSDLTDVVSVVNVAFRGGTDTVDPNCPHVGRADANCDCVVGIQDVVIVVNHAFRGDVTPYCDPCGFPPCQ
ncbi:MAG: S8 family serine peptidase [Candidatus Zixiibacteriota bacterium]